jgi:hypothetical protein
VLTLFGLVGVVGGVGGGVLKHLNDEFMDHSVNPTLSPAPIAPMKSIT